MEEPIQQKTTPPPAQTLMQNKQGYPQLTPEQIKLIKLYQDWKENLANFEVGDIYHMFCDLVSAIVDMETCDYQTQIDFLVDQLNETREKVGLPPVVDEEEEDDEEAEVENEESGQ